MKRNIRELIEKHALSSSSGRSVKDEKQQIVVGGMRGGSMTGMNGTRTLPQR